MPAIVVVIGNGAVTGSASRASLVTLVADDVEIVGRGAYEPQQGGKLRPFHTDVDAFAMDFDPARTLASASTRETCGQWACQR
jgi:hypothetical protein